jgi:hypothetical protein
VDRAAPRRVVELPGRFDLDIVEARLSGDSLLERRIQRAAVRSLGRGGGELRPAREDTQGGEDCRRESRL